jgi:hypothetical protein
MRSAQLADDALPAHAVATVGTLALTYQTV